MSGTLDRGAESIERLLYRRADAADVIDASTLPPLSDYVDLSVITQLFGDFRPENASIRHGCVRFLWGDTVTTLYADGWVTFDPITADPAVRDDVFEQYEAVLNAEYEQLQDDAEASLDNADALRTSAQRIESRSGELFTKTIRGRDGTSVAAFVESLDPTPGTLVSIIGGATAVNEAIGDRLLAELGEVGTMVSTVRPGDDCVEAVEMDLTVVDCTGTDSSDRVHAVDGCDDLTTVGTEIVKHVGQNTRQEAFGFHSLSQLAPGSSPDAIVRFLATLTRKLRSWNTSGVFVGQPLSVDQPVVAEQMSYSVETRRTDRRVEARVCGKSGVSDAWQPIRLE